MSKHMMQCKVCEAEIAKNAKTCPHCGAKNKKPIYKKWWFWAIVIIVLISACSAGGSKEAEVPDTSSVSESTESTDNEVTTQEESTSQFPTAEVQTVYHVGDVLQDGDLKIVYMSSGEYWEENEYMQPDPGYKYIFLQFAFENTGDSGDESVSSYNFECYADGYAVDQYYGGDEDLSATLSAGRSTSGYIYFTVPENANEIDVEYETNFFTEDKIHFLYEGDLSSGYVIQSNTEATDGAYAVGETVSFGDLKVSYLSCQEHISDNRYSQPRDGYQFICCEFEFENAGSFDEYVSNSDFDCYADGMNCEQSYIRDDMLAATLSSGRKAKGTVTFEVPIDATVVEIEYLGNMWTSERIVFTIR